MGGLTTVRGEAVAVRLRGLAAVVEVDLDVRELEHREQAGLSVAGLDYTRLRALLTIPRWEHVRLASLPSAAQAVVRKRPDLIETVDGEFISRRVGPPLWVEMVTLPVRRWRPGLRAVGRFAPYSARRLELTRTPADVDDLCVQATYWGVGVRVVEDGTVRDLVDPEPFVPQRYTGASWEFAEQTLAELVNAASFRCSATSPSGRDQSAP